MKQLAQKTFSAEMIREGSWGAHDLGKHESTMTLYSSDEPGYAYIEWNIPEIDEVECIGLWFDVDGNLLDYDGTFSLPREAVTMLRESGFRVSEDFA